MAPPNTEITLDYLHILLSEDSNLPISDEFIDITLPCNAILSL